MDNFYLISHFELGCWLLYVCVYAVAFTDSVILRLNHYWEASDELTVLIFNKAWSTTCDPCNIYHIAGNFRQVQIFCYFSQYRTGWTFKLYAIFFFPISLPLRSVAHPISNVYYTRSLLCFVFNWPSGPQAESMNSASSKLRMSQHQVTIYVHHQATWLKYVCSNDSKPKTK